MQFTCNSFGLRGCALWHRNCHVRRHSGALHLLHNCVPFWTTPIVCIIKIRWIRVLIGCAIKYLVCFVQCEQVKMKMVLFNKMWQRSSLPLITMYQLPLAHPSASVRQHSVTRFLIALASMRVNFMNGWKLIMKNIIIFISEDAHRTHQHPDRLFPLHWNAH